MKKILVILTLAVALSACKKDEEGPTRSIFKLTMEAGVNLNDFSAFVIVRDHATTELIDYQPITQGQSVNFETNKVIGDGTIDVIYFTSRTNVNNSVTPSITSVQHYVTAFLAVDVGSEWNWNLPIDVYEEHNATGSYSLTVNDVPPPYEINVSDKYGLLLNPESSVITGSSVQNDVPINSNSDLQLISVHPPDLSPAYMWVSPLVDGADAELDYDDFNPFDQNVTIELPNPAAVQSHIVALDKLPPPVGFYAYNLPGFATLSSNNNIKVQSMTLGFLAEFPVYAVNLFFHETEGSFSYTSVGSAPTSINYVEPSKFMIANRSYQPFEFGTTQPYSYRRVRYGYSKYVPGKAESFSVDIYAGNGLGVHYQFLPDFLINQFEVTPIEKLTFEGADFYIEGGSYSDFLKIVGNHGYQAGLQPAPPFVQTSVTVF